MSAPTSFCLDEEGGVWEARHDEDGFTYKILKKLELYDESQSSTSPDLKAQAKLRRERKKKILLKLKSKYENEIKSWQLLSHNLLQVEQKLKQNEDFEIPNQTIAELDNVALEASGSSFIDELLRKAEAQEAIIQDVSNLCDVAEAICDAREQQLAHSFFDLPVWSSPRELMASLCDSDEYAIINYLIDALLETIARGSVFLFVDS